MTTLSEIEARIPSPWYVDPDDRPDMEYNNHVLAHNGNTVCFMAWSGDPENNEAHEEAARLIAVAPDYAAAAEQMIAHEQAGGDGWWKGFEMLKAAHAKANGSRAFLLPPGRRAMEMEWKPIETAEGMKK